MMTIFVFSGFDTTNIIFSRVTNSWLIVDDALAEIQKAVDSNLTYQPSILGKFEPDKFSNQLPIGLKLWELTDEDCRNNVSLKLTVVSIQLCNHLWDIHKQCLFKGGREGVNKISKKHSSVMV